MFARYFDHDESEEDEESDDVESELYSQLHYCTSGSARSETGEEEDNHASHPADAARDTAISRDLCIVPTSLDRPPCLFRNRSTSCGLQTETYLSLEVHSDLEDNEVDLEDWMLLGGKEMEGDRNIHLNLEFGRIDTGSTKERQKKKADDDLWAISDRDRKAMTTSFNYLAPGIFLPNFLSRTRTVCANCRKTGHPARSCPAAKRRDCCILCGQQGHRQPLCPCRHCPVCGLPADMHLAGSQRSASTHANMTHKANRSLPPCALLSRCSQHCPRCGLIGHLEEVCPDIWRQYHLTTQPGVPRRPGRDVRRRRPAACYNCGRRGHYGHECFQKRMPDAPVSCLPHVCRYDTDEEALTRQTATLSPIRGLLQMKAQKRTWPEKRRERRETKRLKRERAKEYTSGRRGGAKEYTSGRRGGAKGRFCVSPHRSSKGAGLPPPHSPGVPPPRSAAEKRGGPRWMGRLSDRRRKAGGSCGRNLYPPDSSLSRGKAKRRRR
ncbi:zinc finger CCHC domain-containing protein 7-like [Clupea harengus]|uniref:Zinc finger CCHC domain-containing protein 7 n=1 Tax=Clupea harengus TaxID=7950 RepID=A0A6P3WEZ3_CLUHA|nr:zinc finger CCHC domain-containing protein 7-like [Clupea harengus]XP_031413808.1 zinc finger CCHC domain-containing protein 7-like [Clupea harengus]XP_031413809.1 zinc finger CCHC domain-containing protein 7-like [Clupea harengus]